MRIELISLQCECSILPLDYGPRNVSRETSTKRVSRETLWKADLNVSRETLSDPVLLLS